jgi:flagellar capping protein FliD
MKMASRIEVRRTQNAIKGEVDSYNELRDELLKELGEEHETEKGSFSVKKENMESFVSQIQECLDAEVEITVLFTLESLKDIKSETENHYGAIIDLLL